MVSFFLFFFGGTSFHLLLLQTLLIFSRLSRYDVVRLFFVVGAESVETLDSSLMSSVAVTVIVVGNGGYGGGGEHCWNFVVDDRRCVA